MASQKYLMEENYTIVPEDEEISISSLNEKTTTPLLLQKC
jgi:hypothetical protein